MSHQASPSSRRHELSKSAILTSSATSSKYLTLALNNGQVHVLSNSGEKVHVLQTTHETPSSLAINEHSLVIGFTSGSIESWDLMQGTMNTSFKAHDDTVSSLVYSDAKTVISGSRDASLKIWNVEDWGGRYVLAGHTDVVSQIVARGNLLVSASHDGTCRIWKIDTGELLHTLIGHAGKIRTIAFDGTSIVSGDSNGEVRVWEALRGLCTAILNDHSTLISHIRMNHDTIVAADSTSKIIAWSLKSHEKLWTIQKAHPYAVNSMQIKDGLLASCGSGDVVRIWQLDTVGTLVKEIGSHTDAAWLVNFTGDEHKRLFYAFWDDAAVLEILDLDEALTA